MNRLLCFVMLYTGIVYATGLSQVINPDVEDRLRIQDLILRENSGLLEIYAAGYTMEVHEPSPSDPGWPVVDRDNAMRLFTWSTSSPEVTSVWSEFWGTPYDQGFYDDDAYSIVFLPNAGPDDEDIVVSFGYSSANLGPGTPGLLSVTRKAGDGTLLGFHSQYLQRMTDCAFWDAVALEDGTIAACAWAQIGPRPGEPGSTNGRRGYIFRVDPPYNFMNSFLLTVEESVPWDTRMGYITTASLPTYGEHIFAAGDTRPQQSDNHSQTIWALRLEDEELVLVDAHRRSSLVESASGPIAEVSGLGSDLVLATIAGCSNGFAMTILSFDGDSLSEIASDTYSPPFGYGIIEGVSLFPRYDGSTPVGFDVLCSARQDQIGGSQIWGALPVFVELVQGQGGDLVLGSMTPGTFARPDDVPDQHAVFVTAADRIASGMHGIVTVAAAMISRQYDHSNSIWLFTPEFPDGLRTFSSSPQTSTVLSLSANSNPFSGSCRILLAGASSGNARLSVHDLSGRLLREINALEDGVFIWDGLGSDGRPAPPGVYMIRALDGNSAQSMKIVKLD